MKGNKKTGKLSIICIAVFLIFSEFSAITVGAVDMEENEEYQEKETLQDKETEKPQEMQKQEIALKQEEKRISFGQSFSVKDVLEGDMDLQEAQLLLQEEAEAGSTILQIEEDIVRAVGVNQENGGRTVISMQLAGTETLEASNVVKLTVIVDKVTPILTICAENEHIPLYGKLFAQAKLERDEIYADLLEKDEKLKIHYEISTEGGDTVQLKEEEIGKEEQYFLESYLLPAYFFPFQKNRVYELRTYLSYDTKNSPYDLPEASVYMVSDACNAYLDIKVTQDGVYQYRDDFDKLPVLTPDLRRNSLFPEHKLTKEEKEAINYAIISSDSMVVEAKNEKYAGTDTELPVCIRGVGEAMLTVTATGGDVYEIEEQQIPVKVENSSLREEDIEIHYQDKEGMKTQPVEDWINGSFSIEVSETGKEYYSHIGYMLGKGEELETEKLLLEKEMPIQQITYFTTYKERNASTKEAENGTRTVFLGIDKTKPRIEQFSYSKNSFAPTTTPKKAYYAEEFMIEGTVIDEASGIDRVQLTYDATDLEKAEWTDIEKNWEKGAKKAGFQIKLGKGRYPALALRTIDVAGNISDAVRVTENGKDYQEIIVDATEPLLQINTTVEKKNYMGKWTNHPITCAIKEKEQKTMLAGVYQVVYQYVKAQENYDEHKEWKILDENVITIGSSDETDFCNQNGTYYFKAISNSGVETSWKHQDETKVRVRLQQLMPDKKEIKEINTDKKRKNEWYNKESGVPRLEFAYPEYDSGEDTKEYGAPLTVHTVLECELENGKREKQEKQAGIGIYTDGEQLRKDKIEELFIDFAYDKKTKYAKDGIYTVEYWISDEAGNESAHEQKEYKIDTHEPYDLHFVLDGTELEASLEDTVLYERFYKDSVSGEAKAQFGISGMDKLQIMQAKKVGEWNTHNHFASTDGKITIAPDTRCFFYILAEDTAGNTAQIWTRGVVVDQSSPRGKQGVKLLAKPDGENKNHFYHEDITLDIELEDMPDSDNFSGLETVNYVIGTTEENQENAQEILFQFSKAFPTEEEITSAKSFSISKVIDAVKYESNQTYVEVTATDRCGNTITDREVLQIDVTKPEIEISFADADSVKNGHYFDHARTADIVVKELNFDPSLISFFATKDGKDYPVMAGEWINDGNIHRTTVSFAEDGDFVFWAEGMDLADNEAQAVKTDLFTIDMTSPVMEIIYDNEDSAMEGYYKRQRKATIQITEHNFSEQDISLVCEQPISLSKWEHEKDVHIATIMFASDNEYQYKIIGKDLAGNEMAQETSEHFTIDTALPQIFISGVEDGSANKGSIAPQVTVEDANLYPEGIHISAKTGLGETVSIEQQTQYGQTAYNYKLTNLSEMKDDIYYLTVDAEDKAGNKNSITYRYSLNRFGSTYDVSAISRLIEQKYHRFMDMEDIEIIEMNVDRIEEHELYLSKNGKVFQAKEGKRPAKGSQEICYEVEETGNEQLGYTNVYRIYRENFETEGLYNLTLYSKDRAGNEVNNTLSDKQARAQFIIDNTMPKVVIEGIENNEIYRVESKQVNIFVHDNFKLKNAVFHLRNEKGDVLESWDYMALAKEGEVAAIELPGSDEKLFLTYEAADMAGNELIVLPQTEETPKGFFVTTDFWIQYIHSPKAVAVTAAVTILTVFGLVFVKRKSIVKIK